MRLCLEATFTDTVLTQLSSDQPNPGPEAPWEVEASQGIDDMPETSKFGVFEERYTFRSLLHHTLDGTSCIMERLDIELSYFMNTRSVVDTDALSQVLTGLRLHPIKLDLSEL